VPEISDEGRHPAAEEPLWNESWYFDFAAPDGSIGGYVRLGLYPNEGVAWVWAYLVGQDRPLIAVRHHEVAIPRGEMLEVRADGLWTAIHCETPHEHWSLGVEAFAVALDDPADAYGDERGDRVPLGLDLEWEAIAPAYDYPGVTRYEQTCTVSGEILIGNEHVSFDGPGQRDHSWGKRDWWRFGWVWTSGQLEDGTAFHATKPDVPGVQYEPGYVVRDDTLQPSTGFTPETELGEHGLPRAGRFRIHDLDLEVEPLHHAPVRLDSPDGRVTRLPRSLCRYRSAGGGATGVGWTEWNQPATQPSAG
jgi:hypothetical protein